MPPVDKSQVYSQAVLDHLQGGTYPDVEDVISAYLPPSALPVISRTIEQARNDLKVGHFDAQRYPYYSA